MKPSQGPADLKAANGESWDDVRHKHFISDAINLNSATLGTMSVGVREALAHFEHIAFPLKQYQEGRKALRSIREQAQQLWPHCPAPAITGGTTDQVNTLGLNLLARRTTSGPMSVYTSYHEHYGGVAFFERHPRCTVHYIPDHLLTDPEGLAKHVEGADLLFLSHVCWTDGRVLPLDDIFARVQTKSPNTWCIADAAQSLGLFSPPTKQADAVVSSAHKWLFGPQGTGFLWLSQSFMDHLGATNWSGHAFDDGEPIADFEPNGGQNFNRFPALLTSLQLYKELGPKHIQRRSAMLGNRFLAALEGGLRDLNIHYDVTSQGLKRSPAMFSLNFQNVDSYLIYRRLNDMGIHLKCVKCTLGNGKKLNSLRFAVPYFESQSRLEHAAETLLHAAQLAREGK